VPAGSVVSAYAPGNDATARIDDAFASIPAFAYAGNDAMVFKAPTAVDSLGRTLWARGFAGERVQQADGADLHATTNYEGGAVGFDFVARPDLRLGLFAGGGQSRLSLDLNTGSTTSDMVFGGVYGRYAFAPFGAPGFLDFALHGGGSRNSTLRNINNNLLAGGLETATASYNGWYVSPELAYGFNVPLWSAYTLTPSLRVRYVAGMFDGYTESSSSANLTVGSRTLQDIEERAQAKLTHTTAFGPSEFLLTSVHVGVLGIERVGDTTINTVLLGANLPFITPGKSSVGGVLGGAGLEWHTREGVSFFGAGEYLAMSDSSSTWTAKGGIRVGF
jgi:outer membrane autotransporter protein